MKRIAKRPKRTIRSRDRLKYPIK